jgi:phage-related protein
LAAMFSGKYAAPAIDLNGRFFIDRDGDLFKYVLNFLRTSRLCVPAEFHELDALEAEADFYQLNELTIAISELREQRARGACERYMYVEILDFEETAYFYRFYSPAASMFGTPNNSVASATTLFGANLKSGGLVVSGHIDVLRTLPIT